MSKIELRKQISAIRKNLSTTEIQQATTIFTELAHNYLHDKQYDCIAGYYPVNGEINVLPLLRILFEEGKKICLPAINPNSRILEFRHWSPHVEMQQGYYGIMQPANNAAILLPDIVLVPLVAVDKNNNRLGYGGGYYDATIPKLRSHNPRALTIGCGYSFQQIDTIPTQKHDIAVDRTIIAPISTYGDAN